MSFAVRTASRFALSARIGGALLVLISACAAAVVANLGIDLLGDYLLQHDTYDEIEHASRGALSGILLLAIAGAGFALFHAALADARGSAGARSATRASTPGSLAVYVVVVIGATFACVAGMEAADLRFAGRSADDIADLLGGSMTLGGSITLMAAVTSALLSWCLVQWGAAAGEIAVRVLATWFAVRDRRLAPVRIAARAAGIHATWLPLLTRSTSKRGPPGIR